MSGGNVLPSGGGNGQKIASLSKDPERVSSLPTCDSVDRGSSSSSIRIDYRRLMENHAQRAEVLHYYRLMVESRAAEQQQQQLLQQEKKSHEDTFRAGGAARSGAEGTKEGLAAASCESLTTAPHTASRTASSAPASKVAAAAAVASRRCKSSISWTRPRSAPTWATESFAAKQRSKVESAPNTPRQRDGQSHHLRSRTESCVSPSTASLFSSMHPSMISQNTQLRSRVKTSQVCEGPSPAHSYSSRGLRKGVCCPSPRTASQSPGTNPNRQNGASPCPSAVSLRSNEVTPQEISTEEDKQQLQFHMTLSAAASVVQELRGVSTSTLSEGQQRQQQGHLEREKEGEEAAAAAAVEDGNSDQASFMTFETINTIDVGPLLLNRHNGEKAENPPSRNNKKNDIMSRDTSAVRRKSIHPGGSSRDATAVGKLSVDASIAKRGTPNNDTTSSLPHSTSSHQCAGKEGDCKGIPQIADDVHSIPHPTRDRATCVAAVAAMLQGYLVQSRRVLPCYYCGRMLLLSAYRLHVDFCRTHTEVLYARHSLNPLRLVMGEPKACVPGYMASEGEKNAFVNACYQSVKVSMLLCPNCNTSVLIHDLHEHRTVCSRVQSKLRKSRLSSIT